MKPEVSESKICRCINFKSGISEKNKIVQAIKSREYLKAQI